MIIQMALRYDNELGVDQIALKIQEKLLQVLHIERTTDAIKACLNIHRNVPLYYELIQGEQGLMTERRAVAGHLRKLRVDAHRLVQLPSVPLCVQEKMAPLLQSLSRDVDNCERHELIFADSAQLMSKQQAVQTASGLFHQLQTTIQQANEAVMQQVQAVVDQLPQFSAMQDSNRAAIEEKKDDDDGMMSDATTVSEHPFVVNGSSGVSAPSQRQQSTVVKRRPGRPRRDGPRNIFSKSQIDSMYLLVRQFTGVSGSNDDDALCNDHYIVSRLMQFFAFECYGPPTTKLYRSVNHRLFNHKFTSAICDLEHFKNSYQGDDLHSALAQSFLGPESDATDQFIFWVAALLVGIAAEDLRFVKHHLGDKADAVIIDNMPILLELAYQIGDDEFIEEVLVSYHPARWLHDPWSSAHLPVTLFPDGKRVEFLSAARSLTLVQQWMGKSCTISRETNGCTFKRVFTIDTKEVEVIHASPRTSATGTQSLAGTLL